MNPFGRFLEFIKNPSHSRTLGILAILVIALAIPLTVKIAQQQQEIRQQAASNCYQIACGINTGTECKCSDGSYVSWCSGQPEQTCPPAASPSGGYVCTGTSAGCQWSSTGTKNLADCQQSCTIPTSTPKPSASPTPTPTPVPANSLCKTSAGWNGVLVQGSCQENRQAALSLTGPGEPLPVNKLSCSDPICLRGDTIERSDGSWYCFEGDRFVGNAFCSSDSQKSIGVNLSPGTTCSGTATCVSGCTAIKSANNVWYCYNPSSSTACATPDCSTTSSPSTAGVSISLSNLILDGLGNAGDIVNPGSQKINVPKSGKRNITITLANIATGAKTPITSPMMYSSSKMNFKADATFPTIMVANYNVKIKVDGYLSQIYGTLNVITPGTTMTLTKDIRLVAGDINNDDKLDIKDFNLLSSCFGKAGTGSCLMADLDDDGTVGPFDFNLWVREFSGQ